MNNIHLTIYNREAHRNSYRKPKKSLITQKQSQQNKKMPPKKGKANPGVKKRNTNASKATPDPKPAMPKVVLPKAKALFGTKSVEPKSKTDDGISSFLKTTKLCDIFNIVDASNPVFMESVVKANQGVKRKITNSSNATPGPKPASPNETPSSKTAMPKVMLPKAKSLSGTKSVQPKSKSTENKK